MIIKVFLQSKIVSGEAVVGEHRQMTQGNNSVYTHKTNSNRLAHRHLTHGSNSVYTTYNQLKQIDTQAPDTREQYNIFNFQSAQIHTTAPAHMGIIHYTQLTTNSNTHTQRHQHTQE